MNEKRDKSPFFKGLPGFTRADDELLASDAEDSIYRWWWEYLRLSPVLWYARKSGSTPADSRTARVLRLCGDLEDDSFFRWWRSTGKQVFAEAKRPAAVRELDLTQLQSHPFRDKAIYLEVPLTIRKCTIIRQVKKYLEQHHDGRKLNLAETSDATFRLHTKRFRLRVLETGFWVLLYRLLYPEIAVWRIGDRLQIAPHQKVRGIDRLANTKPFTMLSSLTGRFLYKAKYTQLNAEFDSFPNSEKIILTNNWQPFSEDQQAGFEAATVGIGDAPSEWQQWLHEHYADYLRQEIIRRNRLLDDVKMPDSKTRKRLPEFIAGTSDLLA